MSILLARKGKPGKLALAIQDDAPFRIGQGKSEGEYDQPCMPIA